MAAKWAEVMDDCLAAKKVIKQEKQMAEWKAVLKV
jgi:hypothetical protein